MLQLQLGPDLFLPGGPLPSEGRRSFEHTRWVFNAPYDTSLFLGSSVWSLSKLALSFC